MLGKKLIPDATGKLLEPHKFDQTVFKLNKGWANSSIILNRLPLEPSFEAIVDAGELFLGSLLYCLLLFREVRKLAIMYECT